MSRQEDTEITRARIPSTFIALVMRTDGDYQTLQVFASNCRSGTYKYQGRVRARAGLLGFEPCTSTVYVRLHRKHCASVAEAKQGVVS